MMVILESSPERR